MNSHELYKALPRDGSVFRIDTIHGLCSAYFKPRKPKTESFIHPEMQT